MSRSSLKLRFSPWRIYRKHLWNGFASMKRTLIVGYVLALALFLFGQRHPDTSSPAEFHAVVDLTHSIGTPARWSSPPELFETRIDAPAHFVHALWTVDQIPAERL